MSKTIEYFDNFAYGCEFFYNANLDREIDINNGYNCKHPQQEELEEVESEKIGKCFCWSCPLAREAFEEDFTDNDIDNQGFEYSESQFIVI